MSVAGIIVLYEPSDFVLQVLDHALEQLKLLIIVDNNTDPKKSTIIAEWNNRTRNLNLFEQKSVCIINNKENIGMAEAFNQGIVESLKRKVDFVIFLDQDSDMTTNTIDELLRAYTLLQSQVKIGAVTALNIDKNTGLRSYSDFFASQDIVSSDYLHEVSLAMASGTFMNPRIAAEIGGFDGGLFIELADYEMCFRLRKLGYKIVNDSLAKINHELGKVNLWKTPLFQRYVPVSIPWRHYYKIRNALIILLRHGREFRRDTFLILILVMFDLTRALMTSDSKLDVLMAAINGFLDFVRRGSWKTLQDIHFLNNIT